MCRDFIVWYLLSVDPDILVSVSIHLYDTRQTNVNVILSRQLSCRVESLPTGHYRVAQASVQSEAISAEPLI